MKEDVVIEHLMDIKERLGTIEANVKMANDLAPRVAQLEDKQIETEASSKTLRRVVYFMLITMPGAVAAVMKILKD